MTNNASEALARLRALNEARTKGTWAKVHGGDWSVEAGESEDSGACAWQQIEANGKTVAIAVDGDPGWGTKTPQLDANIDAIVAALNALGPLLDIAEAAQHFCGKVDLGFAKSKQSYTAFRAALDAIAMLEGK